jgi:carbon monoxide dehydrogenase subunit G
MARLHREIETTLPPDVAFRFVADFANAARWDPGVASSVRVDEGAVAVGATYRLGVRMGGRVAPMEYRIAAYEPIRRVVLTGAGSGVAAVDDIRFEPSGTGTRIDYTADIRLAGLLRLAQPFLGRAFRKIADDALAGMRRALDEMASRPISAATPSDSANAPNRMR